MMGNIRDEAYALASERVDRQGTFRSAYLDFDRGIRVGHLAVEARLTQIIKSRLTARYGVRMLCDRWGRGLYWQWLCWVPEPNKKAKPLSAGHNFGSTKFYVTLDRAQRLFHAGVQVERAPKHPDAQWPLTVETDWDWHVLLKALREEALPRHLHRLFSAKGFVFAWARMRRARNTPRPPGTSTRVDARRNGLVPMRGAGSSCFGRCPSRKFRATPRPELVEAIMAVFAEVTPVMNLCMYAPCLPQFQRVWDTRPFPDELSEL